MVSSLFHAQDGYRRYRGLWGLKRPNWSAEGVSYTYDTMKLLKEKNPDTDYYFIIGADMVDYLPKWHKI